MNIIIIIGLICTHYIFIRLMFVDYEFRSMLYKISNFNRKCIKNNKFDDMMSYNHLDSYINMAMLKFWVWPVSSLWTKELNRFIK